MRLRTALIGISLLLASAPPLFAQVAMTQSNSVAPAVVPPAPPSAPAHPAPTAVTPVVCGYMAHEGQLVPLRQCVSPDEATRRRMRQQESIREFQLRNLSQQYH